MGAGRRPLTESGLEFRFGFEPAVEEIAFGLERWASLADDLTEPLTAIEQVFRKHEKRLFDTEGAYGPSGRWAPLSDKYLAWKETVFPGRPILELTGTLRAALVEGRGDGAITRVTSKTLEVGADGDVIPYASAHLLGNGVPVRKPVDFEADVRKRGSLAWVIAQVLQAYVVWLRKRAFIEAGTLEPFALDERAESAILAAMESATGNEDAITELRDSALRAAGLE